MSEDLEKFDIPNQDENEELLMVLKAHIFVLTVPILKALVALIIIFLLFWFFHFNQITLLLSILIFLYASYMVYYTYHIWNHDLYILTNKRIICISQPRIMHRVVDEATLDKIMSSSYEIKGPIQTIFNYGTVTLKTAGFQKGLILEYIYDPYDVQQKIITAQRKKIIEDQRIFKSKPKNKKRKILLR